MARCAAQAGEMVIRCCAPHRPWNGDRADLPVGWVIRPEEDIMTVTTPKLMRSLWCRRVKTLHRIVVRLLPRFPELPAEQVEAAVVGRYRDLQHSQPRSGLRADPVECLARVDLATVVAANAGRGRVSGSGSGR